MADPHQHCDRHPHTLSRCQHQAVELLGKRILLRDQEPTQLTSALQYHVFNSALCLGTLVLRDPGNVMAGFALSQIDAAISLFTSLLQHGARLPRYKRNLQWLLNLRTRALSKTSRASAAQQEGEPSAQRDGGDGDGDGHRDQDEDVELLGWRTRLIERAGQGRGKTVRTIPLAAETPTGSQITEMAMPSASLHTVALDSTNDIVRRPQMLMKVSADVFSSCGTSGIPCFCRMSSGPLAITQM